MRTITSASDYADADPQPVRKYRARCRDRRRTKGSPSPPNCIGRQDANSDRSRRLIPGGPTPVQTAIRHGSSTLSAQCRASRRTPHVRGGRYGKQRRSIVKPHARSSPQPQRDRARRGLNPGLQWLLQGRGCGKTDAHYTYHMASSSSGTHAPGVDKLTAVRPIPPPPKTVFLPI